MSTPKQRRRGPVGAVQPLVLSTGLRVLSGSQWEPLADFPGYLVSRDGTQLAREIKVRTNKDGSRWARVMRRGKQTIIRI